MADYSWKRDIVEDAQQVMNNNKSVQNKPLISSLCNEIIYLRAEVERLESLVAKKEGIQQVTISFDKHSQIDGVECKKWGE